MAYHLLGFFAVFLPIVIVVYQLTPSRYRFIVLLAADYVFFMLISGKLVLYLVSTTLLTHYIGLWMERADMVEVCDKKAVMKTRRRILAFGVIVCLMILIVLKYTNFLGITLSGILRKFGSRWYFKSMRFLVPVGLSFYTLQAISYMTDVYRRTIKAEPNLAKIALYMSFFPQIMEGPIARFGETAEALYSGRGIEFDNLKFGYQRIVWGLFKKIVVADRIYPAVTNIFENYASYDGSIALFGAVCYTTQLYMEFSGSIDIVIGAGEIFGVRLPENFRQPFLAKNASDFWHRWHITLGTFFKDYIFYPVSLAKPVKNFAKKVKKVCGKNVSKFVAPTVALFCVWFCNGLWHGANWTFIFYGMYYFVLIFIENILEEPVRKITDRLHINRESFGYRALQFVKLVPIVVIGELFFRADTLKDGFMMLGKIFTDFHITQLTHLIVKLGMDAYDICVVVLGIVTVSVVGILKEKHIDIRKKIAGWNVVPRWIVWYAAVIIIVVLGAYGSGYAAVDLIYAGY